jgi:hypothetical protein
MAAVRRTRRSLRTSLALIPTVALLSVAGLVPTAVRAQAAGTLLSQGQPTTASSTEAGWTGAALATDGNTGTRWSSLFTDPQWISVDLGATRSVSRVRLNWEAAYGKAYRVEVSTDNQNWSTVNTQPASDGGIDDITFTAANARYVRVTGTARATQWGYSLWEMEVYGA